MDVLILEATEAVNLTQGAQVTKEGSMRAPVSGNLFGSAAALQSNLEFLVVSIPEDMTSIHELIVLGNQHFNQTQPRMTRDLPRAEMPLF